MAARKFTKADLVDAVYEKTGMDRKDIRVIVDLFINEAKSALLGRHDIELRGFGTFELRMRKARLRARNPKTGEIIAIRPHGNIAFRPGRELRQDAWNITDEEPFSPS
ncbi:MAG: HU family DNA-binding protein [Treponema sp.]|jgi:integration host factor subunit beta|nr:HU family DNA-binding protein [Treponema sp.]